MIRGVDQTVQRIVLNEDEMEILFRQDPATKNAGGWQRLLVTLQELTDRDTGEIIMPPIILARISAYAFDHGEGGYETRLRSIFGRTLGKELGR